MMLSECRGFSGEFSFSFLRDVEPDPDKKWNVLPLVSFIVNTRGERDTVFLYMIIIESYVEPKKRQAIYKHFALCPCA
jgi:hypothetical protein